MARCGCDDQCNCVVQAGQGVIVDGTGTPTDPYVVGVSSPDPSSVAYRDTQTVDLTLAGSGTGADPYEVSGAVRLDPAGGLTSSGAGVRVKVDPGEGNALESTAEGLAVRGELAVTVDPVGGLAAGANGLGIKVDPASPSPISFTPQGVRVGSPQALEARLERMRHIARGQGMLMGGGERTASATHVFWSAPLFFIPPRRAADQAATFYNIEVPAAGATITGAGGATNKTISGSGNAAFMIPLGDWESLWYILPTSSTSAASVPGNLRVVSYTAVSSLPDDAVLLCWRDGSTGKVVTWSDGTKTAPWINANVTLRAGTGTALSFGATGGQGHFYRVNEQFLEIQGYCRWGGSGISTPVGDIYVDLPFTIPAFVINRGNWNGLGTGKLFAADVPGGSAAGSMDWPMWPWIGAATSRIYFLVPAAGNDSRLWRWKINAGTGAPPNNQSKPLVVERWMDTPNSEMQYQLFVPIRNPIA